jgi:hypothetical protein
MNNVSLTCDCPISEFIDMLRDWLINQANRCAGRGMVSRGGKGTHDRHH